MASLKALEKEIRAIQARNARVEADKAWETSATRRVVLATATYLVAAYLLLVAQAPNPFLNAFVPPTAYALSTLTLPFLKKHWIALLYASRRRGPGWPAQKKALPWARPRKEKKEKKTGETRERGPARAPEKERQRAPR